MKRSLVGVVVFTFTASLGFAQESTSSGVGSSRQIAKYLSNPVSEVISIPVQFNYDENIGIDDQGSKWTTNIQPVVPIPMGRQWSVISRTILPVINQKDIAPGSGQQSGTGDLLQSFFFSYNPKGPSTSDIIWGVGPAISAPTASDELLGSEKCFSNWIK